MFSNARSALSCAAAFLLGASAAMNATESSAQSQEYVGLACFITVSPQCQSEGWSVGQCAQMRFRPANTLGNGNSTRFSMFFGQYAINYQQDGSAIGAVYKNVRFNFVGSGGGNAGETLTKWRIPLVQPANFSQPYIHMMIDIARFSDFGPGDPSLCNARLRISGQKYPDRLPTLGSAETSLPKLEDGLLARGAGSPKE